MKWERAAGLDVELATADGPAASEFLEGFVIHDIASLRREISPRQDLRAVRELRHLIAQGRYDIVHTHQSKAGIVGRLAARGQVGRVVHTVHMASFGPGYGRMASRAFLLAERQAARFTDMTVFVGEELQAMYLRAGVGRVGSTTVIRSPVDIEGLSRTRDWTSANRIAARDTLGLPTDGHLIVWIGALTERKRPLLVITALAGVLRSGEATLAIAGEGPLRTRVLATSASHGINEHVHMLGQVNDIASLLGAADVVVHTSSIEGVPQVVIQALAAGRPIVATDTLGLREVADAPITIVPSSGEGLAEGIRSRWHTPGDVVPLRHLAPWTQASVGRELLALHESLA